MVVKKNNSIWGFVSSLVGFNILDHEQLSNSCEHIRMSAGHNLVLERSPTIRLEAKTPNTLSVPSQSVIAWIAFGFCSGTSAVPGRSIAVYYDYDTRNFL